MHKIKVFWKRLLILLSGIVTMFLKALEKTDVFKLSTVFTASVYTVVWHTGPTK
jgi:hypothetical protein